MKSLANILIFLAKLCIPTEAITTFENSQVIDDTDIAEYGAPFSCPEPGCKVYTTSMDATDVGIYENDALLIILKNIYIEKDDYLVGYHLKAGNGYSIDRDKTNSNTKFRVYIVADSAGTEAVFPATNMFVAKADSQIVTILAESNAVALRNYAGNKAPRVYATGFDAIGTCKPVYTAKTTESAHASKIVIFSGIVTIDFGEAKSKNSYQVDRDAESYSLSLAVGESQIAMSPGYTGCPAPYNVQTQRAVLYTLTFVGSDTADIKFDDFSIGDGKQLTLSVSNTDYNIEGCSSSRSFSLDNPNNAVIDWEPTGTHDYFHVQIDYGVYEEGEDKTFLWAMFELFGSLLLIMVCLFLVVILCNIKPIFKWCINLKKHENGEVDEPSETSETLPTSLPYYESTVIPSAPPLDTIPLRPPTTQVQNIIVPTAPDYEPESIIEPVLPRMVTDTSVPPAVPTPAAPPDHQPTIEFSSKFSNDFIVKKLVGEGAFGCVFEVVNKFDNAEYAVKRIAVDERNINAALGEVRMMALLDHPNIVRYNHTWVEQPPEGWQFDADADLIRMLGLSRRYLMKFDDYSVFIYIQMQLCNYALSDWLKNNHDDSTRALPRMKRWFKQMVSAVDYIHDKNLIHRDLKPSNVLFADRDHLKLCDLGIATERRDEDEGGTNSATYRTVAGTSLYMSPEQRSHSRYSSKTDVFTLGLILTELCVVMTPAVRSEIFDDFRLGMQCELIEDERAADFIRLLTQPDPKNRPTCKEMLDHLFLS